MLTDDVRGHDASEARATSRAVPSGQRQSPIFAGGGKVLRGNWEQVDI